jgi:hypothetical protein
MFVCNFSVAVFWMIYGGTKADQSDPTQEVIIDGYQYPGRLFFSLVRLTLVDEYDYDVSQHYHSETCE